MISAKEFVFVDYKPDWQKGEIFFTYSIDLDGSTPKTFIEKLELPKPVDISKISNVTLNNILQSIHLVLGVSYYKLFVPPKISTSKYTLTKEQAHFWDILYTKGLGEFFYKNKLDYRGLIHFPFGDNPSTIDSNTHHPTDRSLVTLGGGKDSIVTLELLKEKNINFDLFSLNIFPVQEKVAAIAQKKAMVVRRTIDKQILELNQTGQVYNGHVPISAIYAFVALLYALLYDYSYIVFSNERSSNYGNITYLDEVVSHQWSKSFEFEILFSEYIKMFVSKDVQYFSFIRPFYEIKIAEIFTRFPQYFQTFSSSNHNFRINKNNNSHRWDYSSAKTVFVFCILSAFLPKKHMLEIFDKNLYSEKRLIPIFQELLGEGNTKPFECVGTPQEMKVALYRAYRRGEYLNDCIMEELEDRLLSNIESIAQAEREVFSYGNDSNIPEKFKSIIYEN